MVDLLIELCEGSARIIQSFYRTPNLRVESKSDLSPVSEADQKAEEFLRNAIRRRYPSHGLIGEEYGSENDEAEYVWILDPIDGTRSFISGCPLYGTLIGLLFRGEPVLGAINHPALRLLTLGDSKQTLCNGDRLAVADISDLSKATVLTSDPGLNQAHGHQAAFEEVTRRANIFRTWGDCYAYTLVASGFAHAAIDPVMSAWDILPLIPVVRGAGGIITSLSGKDPTHATSALAAVPGIHRELLHMFHGAAPAA